MQKRCPSLCSWCEWCISEGKDRFNREAITYCLYDRYTNEGEGNYPNIDSCEDFKIDPDVTMVELAWWPIAWAAGEINRLSIKKSLLELQPNEQHKTESKMSTERLSAKDFLELYLQDHPYPADNAMIQAAEAYAKQEVEQQTKQLREERGDFHDLLIQLVECLDNGYDIKKGSPIHQEATRLLNQLNQQNEG